MYDDDVQTPLGVGAADRYYKVARFPTRNIKTPIVLFYGGSDSLVDIKVMLKELPRHSLAKEIPHYEHLDFLWGSEVDTLIFPGVFEALDNFKHKRLALPNGSFDPNLRTITAGSNYSDDDLSSTDPTSASVDGTFEAKDIPHLPARSIRLESGLRIPQKISRKRSGSLSSLQSTESTNKRFVPGGISIGTSRATTGTTNVTSPPSSRGKGRNANSRKI